MVVGPLHERGLKSLPTNKRPNQRSRLRAKAARVQVNLGTAAKPLLRMGNGAPEASPRQGAPKRRQAIFALNFKIALIPV